MALLKIKIDLDANQFKAETAGVDTVTAKGSAGLDSFTAKAAGAAFAFNQIGSVASTVAGLLSAPISKFADLQSAMANVESLGVPNIDSMTDAVLSMSEQVAVPLDSLTGGLYEVVSAGVDAAHQIEVLDISARAAKAGLSETNEALKLASAVVKGYGLDWDATEGIMDRAFQTVKLGQTTFPELAANIGQVVPLASALKINMDEVFGSMATLTGVTGNTSEVATQLSAVMRGLANPTKELTKLIQEQTGQTIEQAIQQRGLIGILKIVGDATGGSATKMNELFGRVEAVNGALALSGAQYETVIEKTRAMTDSSGAMNDAFEIQNDTMQSQIQLLENRWNKVLIEAVNVAVPFANSLLDIALKATDSRSEIKRLSDEIDEVNSKFSQLDDVDKLLGRYDTLKKKAQLSKDEHKELRGVIESLSKLYPEAVSKLDEYGNAIDINAKRVKLLVEQQKALVRARNEELVSGALDKFREQMDLIITRDERLQAIKATQAVVVGGIVHGIDNVGQRTEEFRKQLEKNAADLKDNVVLLSNFFDFKGDTGALAQQMGLTEKQVEFLIQRWQKLGKVATEANKAQAGTSGGAVPNAPTATPATSPVAASASVPGLQLDAKSAAEQKFFDKSNELAQEHLKFMRKTTDREVDEARKASAAKLQAEQDYQDRKAELQQQAFDLTVGQFSSLVQTAQGSNKELFALGKGAALAETFYNTYAGATAAFKALAPIPIVGPALGTAAAAAAIASGLANAQKIASTKFEKRAGGGFLGRETRTVATGDFGDGENRLIIANDGEFIINAAATARHRRLLEEINAGARSIPIGFKGGGAVGRRTQTGSVSTVQFNTLKQELTAAIRDVKIVLNGTLEGQEFLREEFPKFERIETQRRI